MSQSELLCAWNGIALTYTAEQKYALEYQRTDLSIIKHTNIDKLSLIAGWSTSFSDTLYNSSWHRINKLPY